MYDGSKSSTKRVCFQMGHAIPNLIHCRQSSTISTDCSAEHNGNQGCSTQVTSKYAYGNGFNNMGGGWYVMKRTQSDGVYVWFWSRNDPSVPESIRVQSNNINPDASWGTPDARFPSTESCKFSDYFNAHQIIFDTTLCVNPFSLVIVPYYLHATL